MNTSTTSTGNRWHPVWKVTVLYVLGGVFIGAGVAQCLTQAFEDGFWPVPYGVVFLALGAYLWSLGTRARLRLAGRREAA